MNKNIYPIIIWVLLFLPQGVAHAKKAAIGEIVRVNEGLKVVYAKYNTAPRQGDILAVYDNGRILTYLKASLITDTILQLAETKNSQYPSDLSVLKPGQAIVPAGPKILPYGENQPFSENSNLNQDVESAQVLTRQLESAQAASVDMESEVEKLIDQNKRLIVHLNQLVDENKALKAKDLSDREEMNQIQLENSQLKTQLKELKIKLNNTINLLEENLKNYEN